MSGDGSRIYTQTNAFVSANADKLFPPPGLISEYDDLLRSMEAQLELYKQEHNKLKKDFIEVVTENRDLNSKLNLELKKQMNDEIKSTMTSVIETEMVLNLKKQLEVCKREKEEVYEMYQSSLRIIDKLEKEVGLHPGYADFNVKTNLASSRSEIQVLEGKLKSMKDQLEIETSARDHLETENLKFHTELAKLKINSQANVEAMSEAKERENAWKDKYMKLDHEYTLLNATMECVVKSRNDLESRVEGCNRKICELCQSNNEAKNKVEEALDIVEKAIMERDAAALREVQLQEEVSRLQLCLQHIIDEAGKKVGLEVEDVKKKYDVSMKEALKDVPNLKSELEQKTQELMRLAMKYKKLEKVSTAKLDKEKISIIRGSETELTVLENQLDTVYKELERVKSKYEDSLVDKRKLEVELLQMNESYQALLLEKQEEDTESKNQITYLKSEINNKIEELNESAKRAEFFVNQICDLQEENKELLKIVGCYDKLKVKLKKSSESRTVQMNELEEHVESQMKLNEKWKNEIREVTEKFEQRFREVKEESKRLRLKNKELHLKLAAREKKPTSQITH